VILIPLAFALSGCEAVALTALGVGASTGVSQTMNGITYRTFTLPVPRVRVASLSALKRMGIKVESTGKMEGGSGEVIKAKAADREIEIQLEAISANTTRMRTTVKSDGLLYDSATATEIIVQTERVLGNV
jgi:hypothetical protein